MKGNWGGAEWSVPQRVVQQLLERSVAGSPAECSRPQRVVQQRLEWSVAGSPAECSRPQRVVQQRLERSVAGSPAECSRPQRVVQRAGLAGGEWLLVGSSPAVCAVCVADVLACAAAARCPPLYLSAGAPLPLRSRLARAPREHTAVRGRTRGVDGGAGCPTERGKVTSDERHGFSMGAAWVLHGCCMGGMVGFADEMGWD